MIRGNFDNKRIQIIRQTPHKNTVNCSSIQNVWEMKKAKECPNVTGRIGMPK